MSDQAFLRRLEAEVKCLNCGHVAGLLRRELPPAGPVVFPAVFQDSAHGAPATVRSLAGLHCTRCGGSLYTDEYREIAVHPHPSLLEKPRRGRPPKRPDYVRR